MRSGHCNSLPCHGETSCFQKLTKVMFSSHDWQRCVQMGDQALQNRSQDKQDLFPAANVRPHLWVIKQNMQIYRTWLSGLGTIKGCISQEFFVFVCLFFSLPIYRNPAGIRQKAKREFTGSLNARTTSLREGKGIYWGLGISGTKDATALPRVSPLHPQSHQRLFGWSFSLGVSISYSRLLSAQLTVTALSCFPLWCLLPAGERLSISDTTGKIDVRMLMGVLVRALLFYSPGVRGGRSSRGKAEEKCEEH